MAVGQRDVWHFLGRVGFAPSDAEVDHFVGREIPDIVDEVLNGLPTLPPRPAHLDTEPPWRANRLNMDLWLNRMADSSWVSRAGDSPHPLVEKLTVFWHGHFATNFRKLNDAVLMWEQNQTLRTDALGDFERMCQQISTHGAMLRYLDNESNRAGAVQENFARELMELFTCGIGHYTETDVVEVARAWTGHGTIGWIREEQRYDGTYRFHPDRHDYDDKTIFGITKNWDGPDVITELCRGSRQQATAAFLATKLWRFLVNGNPPAAAIESVAAAFVAADMNITELVRAILIHPEFWAESSRRALVKSPTQYVVDFCRCTGWRFENANAGWRMEPMGQVLFEPPNVAGWGVNGYWLSTATMWGRAEFVNGLRWSLVNDQGFLAGINEMNAPQATDLLLDTFRIPYPSAVTRDSIEEWFSRTRIDHQWALAVAGMSVTVLSPDFQVN